MTRTNTIRAGRTRRGLAWAGLALALAGLAPDEPGPKPDAEAAVGTSYRVPYRLTQTNHYLVRVRINGKGPFNFLVDTGAPALYIGTDAAKAIGLRPSRTSYWTDVDRFDIEGGATLRHLKARIDDPFQLTGMNALGLPGASIDGILGFTILARFRMEFDPTQDRMTWTLLDFQPKEPPAPRPGDERDLPPELQMMNAFGPLAKLTAMFVGKQPEDELHPRGFLGLELAEADGQVRASAVLPGSPAAKAGLRPGDRLVRIKGGDVTSLAGARQAVAKVRAGDPVEVVVRRGPGTVTLTLTAGEGF